MANGVAPAAAAVVLNHLILSLDRRTTFEVLRREYNVGTAGRVQVMQNPEGQGDADVPDGALKSADREAVMAAMEKILADLG